MIKKNLSRIGIFLVFILLIIYIVVNFSIFWPKISRLIGLDDPNSAKIIHIIDGDSILVLQNDKITEIRMIGFDAPELNIGDKPRQCYAQRAITKLNDYFTESRDLKLIADSQVGDTDKYGRTLRYVMLPDDTDIAQEMIRNGFGREMTVQDYSRQEDYQQAQKEAEVDAKGLWGEGSCS